MRRGDGVKCQDSRPDPIDSPVYFRIAEKVLSGDLTIPAAKAARIKQIAAALPGTAVSFTDDPLIIRGTSLTGPFTVIEGHHRATAIALTVLVGTNVQGFAAFIGVDKI